MLYYLGQLQAGLLLKQAFLKVLYLALFSFLVYINDIVENIHSSIRLFADDTSLYIIVEEPVNAAYQLNNDLQKTKKKKKKRKKKKKKKRKKNTLMG